MFQFADNVAHVLTGPVAISLGRSVTAVSNDQRIATNSVQG